jgi:hypothetical protein
MKLSVAPKGGFPKAEHQQPTESDFAEAWRVIMAYGGDIQIERSTAQDSLGGSVWARCDQEKCFIAEFDDSGEEIGSFSAGVQDKVNRRDLPATIEIGGDYWPADGVCKDFETIQSIFISYLNGDVLGKRADWLTWD